MERNIVYILAACNLALAFILIYFERSPFAGRKNRQKKQQKSE